VTARVNRYGDVIDTRELRHDAGNLAAFLYDMRRKYPDTYAYLLKIIQLALPFLEDFVLEPRQVGQSDDYDIRLYWKRNDSDYIFSPVQLSDGSLRYICLAVALLQPHPLTTVLIDEPELGQHPANLVLISGLLESASTRMQVVIAPQSMRLLSEFNAEHVLVVEVERGKSDFTRLEPDKLTLWLEEYPLGDIWEKNVIGGYPA
jgi:predicted ATPase